MSENKRMYDRVKCAAILLADGKLIIGYRHCDCFHNMAQFRADKVGAVQGFVDHNDKFLTREEAANRALEHGQMDKPVKELFSEDLY